MVFACIVIGLRTPLNNRIQIEVGDSLDERNMEGLRAQSVADYADVVFTAGHCEDIAK